MRPPAQPTVSEVVGRQRRQLRLRPTITVQGPLLVLRAVAPLSPPQAVGDKRRERLSGRLSPADAKRMPGRVRVHLVTLGGTEIRSWLEQPGAEGHRLFVRGSRVIDVEVEMHLL